MSKYNLSDTDYQLIFPENLKKYKNLKTLAFKIEDIIKKERISRISKLAIFKNLEFQSDEVLSDLAWQFSIDNWQETLDRETKINLIKNAYWAHSKKGTKNSIQENLKKLGYLAETKEWFEVEGIPFTFEIKINSVVNTVTNIEKILEMIEKYKNCRSVLNKIDFNNNRKFKKLNKGSFRISNIYTEHTGIRENIIKRNKFNCALTRVIKMEVGECLKD